MSEPEIVTFPSGGMTIGPPGNAYIPAEIHVGGRVHECRFRRVGRAFVADKAFMELRNEGDAPPRHWRRRSIAAFQDVIRAEARAIAAIMERRAEQAPASCPKGRTGNAKAS